MVPKFLVATGIIDGIDFQSEFSDVEFVVVEKIVDALEELKKNPTSYEYVLISASSFVVSGGLDIDETMKALAEVLAQTTYERFVLLDIHNQLEVAYNMYMREIRRKARKNTDNQVRIRTYYQVVKAMLKNVADERVKSEHIPPPPPKPVEKRETKKQKKSIFESIKKLKVEKPKEKLQQPPVIQQPVKKQQEFDYNVFKRNTILLTSPSRKAGSTTLALAMSSVMADKGLNVVYVQLTERLFTCNCFVKESECMRTQSSNIFKDCDKDLEYCISVYKNIHMLTNTLYDKIELNQTEVADLLYNCSKSFDTVIVDIDFDLISRFPSLLPMFRYFCMVLTNTVDCCVEVADTCADILQGDNKPLGVVLTQSANIAINRVSERFDTEGEYIASNTVIPRIVDIDFSLANMEFLNVLGEVKEDYSVMNDPFSDDAKKEVVSLIERLK